MDPESVRHYLLKLPQVEETMQWGANLIFWVGDKAIGGKMFAVLNLDEDHNGLLSFAAGPERYSEFLELDGIFPAPYLARAHWVAVRRWGVFRDREWEENLKSAHGLVYAKLPKRTRDVLRMPSSAQKKLVKERKKLLAERGQKPAAPTKRPSEPRRTK